MPVLFLDRLPLPSLQVYTAFSIVPLVCSVYYAVQVTSQPDWKANDTSTQAIYPDLPASLNASNETQNNVVAKASFSFANVLYYMIEEPLCIWTLINMAYCCLILFGKLIQKMVFGELRVSEQQHIRDKFWNFVFYKFIFVFGIINVQFMDEVILWCSWFSVLGFLHFLVQLCKDRFEYLSSSPTTPKWTHIRLLSLLTGIMATSIFLFIICILVGVHAGLNTFAFMAAECVLVNLRTLFVITRYAIQLWDMHQEGIWENRATYVYYTQLIFELTVVVVDLFHHVHMLVWSNIFLSMASLVIAMQIRYMFYDIQRQFRKHKNYLRVMRHVESNFAMATAEELTANSDDCAICWDKMDSARKLPCGHLFHNSCLRSWLEQDASCPTCRKSLSTSTNPHQEPDDDDAARVDGLVGTLTRPAVTAENQPNRATTNHFFHFDASRYVSWLPSFSVEVTHTQLLLDRPTQMRTSQLDNMARQVQQMFPYMPLGHILDDLRATRSVEVTIENILDERLVPPPFQMQGSRPVDTTDGLPLNDLLNDSASNIDNDSSSSSSASSTKSSSSSRAISKSSSCSSDSDCGRQILVDNFQTSQDLSDDEFQIDDEPHLVNHTGGRFSKSPRERERMLASRKENLVRQAKRRYLSKISSHCKSLTDDAEPTSSTCSDDGSCSAVENRRYLAYEAAQRRLKQNHCDRRH